MKRIDVLELHMNSGLISLKHLFHATHDIYIYYGKFD